MEKVANVNTKLKSFYTVQDIRVLKSIKENNKFISKITEDELYLEIFKTPYKFMKEQLKILRNIDNSSNSLIWLWDKIPGYRHGYGEYGDSKVLLEIKLHENEILASDFDAWHIVLMSDNIEMYTGEDIDKTESWKRVFDLELCRKLMETTELTQEIQYVTGEIPIERIKVLVEFICEDLGLDDE